MGAGMIWVIRKARRGLGAFLGGLAAWAVLAPAPALAQQVNPTPAVSIGVASLIDPASADAYYGSHAGSSGSSVLQSTPAELTLLAQALPSDPGGLAAADKIYQYVRNNIEITWTYGLSKGALGAMIDRAGTAFDQANLMVVLLQQAGYTASYQAGTITLNGAQFAAWSGITNATAACQLLANGGIPAQVNGSTTANCNYGSATVSSVTLAHVWVSAQIGGTSYVFDPAYKTHVFKSGVNLAGATGLTSGAPLAASSDGGTTNSSQSGVNFVQNLNMDRSGGLTAALTGYASNYLAYLSNNSVNNISLAAAEPEDVIGGQLIARYEVPSGGLRQTSLPYASTVQHSWGAIPGAYRTTLRVQIAKVNPPDATTFTTIVDKTLFVDEIYGRKLIFDTNFDLAHPYVGNNGTDAYSYFIGSLRLLDEAGAGPDLVGSANCDPSNVHLPALAQFCRADKPTFSAGTVTLTANHPYVASANGGTALDGSYMDATTTKPVDMVLPFVIASAWGDADRGLVDKWGTRTDKSLPSISNTTSSCETCYTPITGSEGDGRREQLTAAWIVQASRAARRAPARPAGPFCFHPAPRYWRGRGRHGPGSLLAQQSQSTHLSVGRRQLRSGGHRLRHESGKHHRQRRRPARRAPGHRRHRRRPGGQRRGPDRRPAGHHLDRHTLRMGQPPAGGRGQRRR